MPHWNCSSSLCFNTSSSKLKYYRLPRNPNIQREYKRLFKTEGWNWREGFICCEHWENKLRKTSSDLPNVIVPSSQIEKLKEFVDTAKENCSKNPSSQNKAEFTNLKRKLEAGRVIPSKYRSSDLCPF